MLTRLHPGPVEHCDLDQPGWRSTVLDWYRPPRRDWVRLNLVTSITGSATGDDGTSETLSNRTDRRVLGVIRELSDCVLVGAASVRAEGYQLPRRAPLAVATISGNLSGHRLAADQSDRVTVLCPPDVVDRVTDQLPGARVLPVERSSDGRPPDGRTILDALTAAGYRSIVCEGGPALAATLLAARVVDEICLTTSPRVGPVTLPAFASTEIPDREARLIQLALDESEYLFARWSLGAP